MTMKLMLLVTVCLLLPLADCMRRQRSSHLNLEEYSRERRRNRIDDCDDVRTRQTNLERNVLSKLTAFQDAVRLLSQQAMIQQEFVEERIRSVGQSGIVIVRRDTEGTRNYYSSSHIDTGVSGVHDHSDYYQLLGMGEVCVVINGVEFRTRHNDYKFNRPSSNSTKYRAVESIPFPDVPVEVTSKATVEEQIVEMRKWFEAFQQQNSSVRDYRPYFKANICYMEAAWTNDSGSVLTEPFQSDRHYLNGRNWDDLMAKLRYTTYTGIKDNFENLGFLPRKIMSVDPVTGLPVYAQWNYRILCFPIPFDLPTKNLKQRDDFHWRYPRNLTEQDVKSKRAARFHLNDEDNDDKFTDYTLLDKVMELVPGMDNIPSPGLQELYGGPLFSAYDGATPKPLAQGFYNRWYKFAVDGAMGSDLAHRGFNDESLFVALNTQKQIVPMSITDCKNNVCTTSSARVSYAIPLEVVYMTPLSNWNPYNICFNNTIFTPIPGVEDGLTNETALRCAYRNFYYRTPASFFTSGPHEPDDADTPRVSLKVRAGDGKVVDVSVSGTQFFLPDIGEAKEVRLRYPIPPIHGEGSTVYKEVNALRDRVKANIPL